MRIATSPLPVIDPLATTPSGQMIAELYVPILAGLGTLILLVAWLPLVLRKAPLSLPIICVGIGWLIFTFTPLSALAPHPLQTPIMVEKASELIVIVSLMGAGLKLDRALTWRGWQLTVRLLAIAMPLSIGLILIAGQAVLGLGVAAALLLAAALAPTDPVLASDVQIEQPDSTYDDEARFALTSEAGLNDALAFPFVHLAVAAATVGLTGPTWADWFATDVVMRLSIGAIVGVASGWAIGRIIYHLPRGTRLSRTGDGFVALGATLAVYAVTELAYGYGFLAVFLAGLMVRRAASDHEFNKTLHGFADETERLLMMVLLLLFGGMLAGGGLLISISWAEATFAALVLLVIRPLAGMVALAGIRRPLLEKGIIAAFGIRGMGSIFYLAWGLNHADFGTVGIILWEALALVVLASILLHGVTVTPLMRRLDRLVGNDTREKSADVGASQSRPS